MEDLLQKLKKDKVFVSLLNSAMGLHQTTIKSFGNINDSYFKKIYTSFEKSIALESKNPDWILDLEGLSGKKYRHLINNLIASIDNPRYLEIGSWQGSTACAAASGNKLNITCIDDWSQTFANVENVQEKFKKNIKKIINKGIKFKFLNEDFRKINYKDIGKYNIYLFDGPHHQQDHYDSLKLVHKALDRKFILIVDDWNWDQVRSGTLRAIKDMNFKPISRLEIKTTHDSSSAFITGKESEWHNGYCFFVIEK